MILVLGATGNTGGEVARLLIASGERPRLLVRDPDKAREFGDAAEVVRGDVGDLASVRAAMEGIDRVYLMSSGTDPARREGHVVDAAAATGVRHVVKLSVLTADQPAIAFARGHAAAERRLMDSGVAWTMLRPGNFMTNALVWADTVRAQGAFYQPTGTGRWAAIDPADIAAVAARALTEPGHEGQSYELTGPEAMDAAGYAAVLGRVLGRPVRFVDVPPEAARASMEPLGIPAEEVDALLELNAAMKSDRMAAVTDTVGRLLGRPPATFESWARRHATAFA